MKATWDNSDSEESSDKVSDDEVANLYLMANKDEKASKDT